MMLGTMACGGLSLLDNVLESGPTGVHPLGVISHRDAMLNSDKFWIGLGFDGNQLIFPAQNNTVRDTEIEAEVFEQLVEELGPIRYDIQISDTGAAKRMIYDCHHAFGYNQTIVYNRSQRTCELVIS